MNGLTEPGKKSIALLILLFTFLGLSLIAVNHYESRILSGVRAYIAGNGQWIKAQKEASLALVRYIVTEEEIYFTEFEDHLDVIEGDRLAREQLESPETDYELVKEGFIRGRNLSGNVKHLIWLFENFSSMAPIERAIGYWVEGEAAIDEKRVLAREAQLLINNGEFDSSSREKLLNDIYRLDEVLARVEEDFANELNQTGIKIAEYVYWVNILVILILTLVVAIFAVIQLRGIKVWSSKIQESEKKFREVLTNSRDVIYQLDIKTGKYLYISPSIKEITGYEAEDFMDGGVEMVLSITHPEDAERMQTEVIDYSDEDVESKLKKDSQFRIKRKDGVYIWINNKRSLLRDEEGQPRAIIGNVRDISERKKYVDALDESLKEKDMLLSEIHHRVKNNLSIVSSLVELQKNKDGETSEEDLNQIQSRIKSIAMVHEKLYENKNFADVDLAIYLGDLVDMIYNTYDSRSKKITIHKKLDSVIVNIKKAVPIGLICNELMNNCYKYAFKEVNKGEINVDLNVDDSTVTLKVYDNGVGLPEKFDELKKNSLGMTLIKVFTKQVQGKLEYGTNGGTQFSVKFDIDNKAS